MYRGFFLLLPIFLFLHIITEAQFASLADLLAKNDSLNKTFGREKLFVHIDKQVYMLNDTLWFRGYILDAAYNQVRDSSGIAYVEIADENGIVLKRVPVAAKFGTFFNTILLSNKLFSQGTFTLRAYTNYMRNFGDSLFFECPIKVIDPLAQQWKATIKHLQFSNNRLAVIVSLKGSNVNALAGKKLHVVLRSKKNILYKRNKLTDFLGNIYIDTLLAIDFDTNQLSLEIFENKNQLLKVPLKEVIDQNIDLQFMPEGGNLILGKRQKIGFKAIDIYGKGIEIKGVIKDGSNNTVASFSSTYKGMGAFWLEAKKNEVYTAYLENGKSYKLPQILTSGTTLEVKYSPLKDSIIVSVDATPDLYSKPFFIAGSIRGINYFMGKVPFKNAPYKLSIPTTVFPNGVIKITLYNEQRIPVNERAVFAWNSDVLDLNLTPNKASYFQKDSVHISLQVKKSFGENTVGSFSISVIDTSQIPLYEDAENIMSYMLLSSDIKGHIEAPYFYLQNPTSDTTDYLMLTQGWINYVFDDVANRKFAFEKQYSLSGRITNILNRPSGNTTVNLLTKGGSQRIFFDKLLTNKDGSFTFKNFPLFANDSIKAIITAVNKKDKSFGIGVEIPEKSYPPYISGEERFERTNILFDTTSKKVVENRAALLSQMKKDATVLEEVIVSGTAKIPGSKNLNEDGGADQTIRESELEKTPKKTLLDVLYEKIPGFKIDFIPQTLTRYYWINANKVRFIFDGIDLNFFYDSDIPNADNVNFVNQYLKYYIAEDIKGIEVMNYPRYNTTYRNNYLTPDEQYLSGPTTIDYSFIEITTQGGVGPFLKKTPGVFLMKLDAPYVAKEFYSPRYKTPDQETINPDLRSTIYWNPNVIANQNGYAEFSFYTSESKSNYIMIIQGTDFEGHFGVKYLPLFIKPKK